MISACFLILFCLACNSVPENWHICVNKGFIYYYYYSFYYHFFYYYRYFYYICM